MAGRWREGLSYFLFRLLTAKANNRPKFHGAQAINSKRCTRALAGVVLALRQVVVVVLSAAQALVDHRAVITGHSGARCQ